MLSQETKCYLKNFVKSKNNFDYNSISQVNSLYCAKIAIIFQNLKHAPQNSEVFFCYEQFKAETKSQFLFLRECGVSVRPWLHDGQPYLNSKHLFDEFCKTKTLFLYLTASGYGPDCNYEHQHPMLEESGICIDGISLTYNDLFRAVHDVFGHINGFNSFSCLGELRAALNHMKLYSEEACQAMLSETVGQICWYYFGPHLCEIVVRGKEEIVKMHDQFKKNRRYPEQKAVLLPKELYEPIFNQ